MRFNIKKIIVSKRCNTNYQICKLMCDSNTLLLFLGLFGIVGGAIANQGNGLVSGEFNSRKRRRSQNSEYDDGENYYTTHITEERYRSMLGEHIQKYKRRFKDSSASPAPTKMVVPMPKSNLGLKGRKLRNEQRGGFLESETTPDWLNDINPPKTGNFRQADFAPPNDIDRLVFQHLL